MQELLVENCWEEASLNSSEAIQEQTSLNTSRKRKYPVLRTYMRSLTNLIKHTKISYFIASLAFRTFLCVSSEISTPRSSRLRYSKCLRRYQPCSYDIFLPEIFFFSLFMHKVKYLKTLFDYASNKSSFSPSKDISIRKTKIWFDKQLKLKKC